MSQQQKIAEFQMVSGVDETTARKWLTQANWTVDLGLDLYFNSGSTPPTTLTQPDPSKLATTTTSGPSASELLQRAAREKRAKEEAEARLLSRCMLKFRNPKPQTVHDALLPELTEPLPGDEVVPLKGTVVQVGVTDIAVDVHVQQRFLNPYAEPMEVMYSFRQDHASLYHFEAHINGKDIVGVCKEKEKAFDKYDNALSSGHGAFLAEQGETMDSFQINVGNLAPKQECIISIKYASELEVEGEALRLHLPISATSFTTDSSQSGTPEMSTRVPAGFSLSAKFSMPSPIVGIQCSTHHVATEIDGSTAAVFYRDSPDEKERTEMALLIGLSEPLSSRSLIEHDETTLSSSPSHSASSSSPSHSASSLSSPSSVASSKDTPSLMQDVVMVTFFPQFEVDEDPVTELILLVDQSGSMAGSRINQAKNALQLFLRSMSEGVHFNIIGFGTNFHKLFPQSVPYSQDTLARASSFVQQMAANMGGTDILTPLRDIFTHSSPVGNRQVLLLTDGQVSNTGAVIDACRQQAGETRVFTFGIGSECSLALVKGCAVAARGHFEFVASGERIESKVLRTLKKVMQPVLSSPQVDWGTLPVQRQVPAKLPPIFAGEKLVVFGFLDKKDEAKQETDKKETKVVLRASIGSQTLDFSVAVDPSLRATGSTVHRLAARAVVRDAEFQPDDDDARKTVVPLATRYGLVSKFTSIVAIDERSEQVQGTGALKVVDLLQNSLDAKGSNNPLPSLFNSAPQQNNQNGMLDLFGTTAAFNPQASQAQYSLGDSSNLGRSSGFGGSSTSTFGGSSTSPFGGASFGGSSTSPFGGSSTSPFGGASSTPTFGGSSTSTFGGSSSTSTSNPFAQLSQRSSDLSHQNYNQFQQNFTYNFHSQPQQNHQAPPEQQESQPQSDFFSNFKGDTCQESYPPKWVNFSHQHQDCSYDPFNAFGSSPKTTTAQPSPNAPSRDSSSGPTHYLFNPVAVHMPESDHLFPQVTPSSHARPLDRLVLLQQANGSWPTLGSVLKEIGHDLTETQVRTEAQKIGLQCEAPHVAAAVATSLAIRYIERTFENEKEEWELLVEKAKKWLRRACSVGELSKVAQLISQILK